MRIRAFQTYRTDNSPGIRYVRGDVQLVDLDSFVCATVYRTSARLTDAGTDDDSVKVYVSKGGAQVSWLTTKTCLQTLLKTSLAPSRS